ncbi:MAG: trigger factor [Bacteroidota bacterium]|nr:trigger factor [Bacteroidota bacterium]
MEVTIKSNTDCEQEMHITMSQEELAPHFEKAYREAAPALEIKGFRKGKVPMHMIKKMFGASIEYQAVEDISNDMFRKEIEARDINPIGTPTIVKLDFKPGTPLNYAIKYEVRPQFELKDYSGLTIEKYIHSANDTEVTNEIERLQQINSTMEEAQKIDGENYVATVDMLDLDAQGHSQQGMRIYLKEKSTEPEIKDALKGVSVGDVKEVKFTHQHGDRSHDVHLQLTIKKIEKVLLPTVDDALAQKVSNGKFQTIEELKTNIKKDLEDFWKERADRRFENDLLSEIVKQYEFTVPESLIQNVTDTFIDDAKNQQPNKQLPKNFNEKQYREQSRETAIWQSKWLLIKEQFITKEKIEIADAEIEKIAEEESAKLNIDKERLVNFYKSSENALERLKYNRLIDILKQNVKITEVVTDDYSKFAVQQ